MEPRTVKTSDTILLDFSKPLKRFEWFKQDMKLFGRSAQNLACVYHRYKTAIERIIPIETRREIYNKEKDEYIKQITEHPETPKETKDAMIDLVIRDKDKVAIHRAQNILVTKFFTHLLENGMEAREHLDFI